MKMMSVILRCVVVAITAVGGALVLAAPGTAAAQKAGGEIEVTAQMAGDRVYVNDGVELSITVNGSNAAERPVLRLPEGVEAEFVGGTDRSSHFVSITNGVREERSVLGYEFQFRITATREGEFTIPGADVMVGGKVYRGPEVRFVAVRPENAEGFALRVEVDRRSLYVGEPTRLRVVWELGASVKQVSFSRLPGIDDFEVATPRNKIPTGQRGASGQTVEIPMFGRQVVGTWGEGTAGGKQVRTLTFEQVIVPKSAGKFQLGSMTVSFDAVIGERARSFFDSPWDDRAVTRRRAAMSEPVTIEVKELPTQGRPKDFGGLVGAYSMKYFAEPASVGVGDPIVLKLVVDGPDPMDRVIAPDLAKLPAFNGFKLSGEGWHTDSGDMPGPRAFSATVRANDASVKEIPAIEIPYFDPEEGAYKRAKAGPLALHVRATREVTSADAVGAAPLIAAPIAPATVLDSAGPGPVANATGAWVLADEGVGLSRAVRTPLVAVVLAAPPLAFVGLVAVRRKREREATERARITRARREASRDLAGGARDAKAVGAALRKYAGAVLGMDPAAVTAADCGGQRAPGLGEVGRVLGACEAGEFGGMSSGEDLAVRARAAIEEPRQGGRT